MRDDFVYRHKRWPRRPGNRHCRVCGKPRPKGHRRTATCDACRALYYATPVNWNQVRYSVWKRDQGVCSACGMHTENLHRVMSHVSDWKIRKAVLRHLGFVGCDGKDYWAAHHENPVASHGPARSIDEIITLCVPCHKKRHGWRPPRVEQRQLPGIEGALELHSCRTPQRRDGRRKGAKARRVLTEERRG